MRRRTLLAGATTALLGGCLSAADPESPSQRVFSDEYSVSVQDTAIESAAQMDLAASIEAQFTSNSPAMVSVRVTNSSEATRTISGGPTLPFRPQRAGEGDGDASLFLVPEDGFGFAAFDRANEKVNTDLEFVPDEPADGCWEARATGIAVFDIAQGETLRPGASTERSYVLLAHPDNEACLSERSYTFTDELGVDESNASLSLTLEYGRS